MGNSAIALYVVGALFTLYVIAAASLSKDAAAHARKNLRVRKSPIQALDRGVVR
jgi:hypothetical protein